MKYKKFKLSEIFKWQSQKEIDPLKIGELTIKNSIKYPFYGQATSNNGIISYESLDEKVLNNKNGLPTILIHSNNQNIISRIDSSVLCVFLSSISATLMTQQDLAADNLLVLYLLDMLRWLREYKILLSKQ